MTQRRDNLRNTFPNLTQTFLHKQKLEKLKIRHPNFFKILEDINSKAPFKVLKIIATFLQAKISLDDEEIRILYAHFSKACQTTINKQDKKMKNSKAYQRQTYIDLILGLSSYITQIFKVASLSEDFILEILNFVFQFEEGALHGRGGRKSRQQRKLKASFQYLRQLFNSIINKREVEVQTEDQQEGEMFARNIQIFFEENQEDQI